MPVRQDRLMNNHLPIEDTSAQRLHTAADCLAGEGSLAWRVAQAFAAIAVIMEADFPQRILADVAEARQKISEAGGAERLSPEELEKLAQQVVGWLRYVGRFDNGDPSWIDD